MSQLIETYIDRLLQDPNALPPAGMDAETAEFVRALVASQSKPSAAQRARMWQRSLDAAKTAIPAHSQTTTFRTSSNGHQVHISHIYGEEPMTTSSIPIPRPQRRSASGVSSILPLAAAIAFVVLGIALFASVSPTTPSLTTPPDDGSQGSLLGAETETATPVPFATPLIGASLGPTLIPAEAPAVLEYTIQEGDTLLSIIQQFPLDYSSARVISEILRLNPSITSIVDLPSPGSVILIPVVSATALPTLVPSAETATPFPITLDISSGTPTPVPIEIRPSALSGPTGAYVLQSGESILTILTRFDITLQGLAELNPQIDTSGCDFSRLTGGMNCAFALLTPGDEINAPDFDLMPIEADSTAQPPTVVSPKEMITSTPFPRSDSTQPPTPVLTSTPIR